MKKNLFPILLALVPLTSCGGALFYTAEPIEAWVVDAETSKPIEGAVIVANWQLVVGSLDGPRDRGQLEMKEAVTDKNGRFYIEGFTKMNPMLYELRDADPRILVFKAGYEYKTFFNDYPNAGTETPGIHRKSAIAGKTIQIKKHDEPDSVDSGGRPHFYSSLNDLLEPLVKDCGWKKYHK